jgi:hypothetical protein
VSVTAGETRLFERLVLLASAVYFVSLFFPWEGSSPGRIHGWDTFLGVVCGVIAFALFATAHASFVARRLNSIVVSYLAAALAFFTATRLIDEAVLRSSGLSLDWGAYVGIGASSGALLACLVVSAGGWGRFAGHLPGWLRIDRI